MYPTTLIFSLDNAKVGFHSQNMPKKIKIPCVPSTQDGTRVIFFFSKTATCSSGLQVPRNFFFCFFFLVTRYSEQRFIMKTDICLPYFAQVNRYSEQRFIFIHRYSEQQFFLKLNRYFEQRFPWVNKKKHFSRVPSYVDGTQGILVFLDIFWELKPTFALFKEKIIHNFVNIL